MRVLIQKNLLVVVFLCRLHDSQPPICHFAAPPRHAARKGGKLSRQSLMGSGLDGQAGCLWKGSCASRYSGSGNEKSLVPERHPQQVFMGFARASISDHRPVWEAKRSEVRQRGSFEVSPVQDGAASLRHPATLLRCRLSVDERQDRTVFRDIDAIAQWLAGGRCPDVAADARPVPVFLQPCPTP